MQKMIFFLLVLVWINPAWSQEPLMTEIDFTGKEPVVKTPKYEDLPEEFRANVSPEEFRSRYEFTTDRLDAMMLQKKVIEDRSRFSSMFQTMSSFQFKLAELEGYPELIESLEFSEDQIKSLKNFNKKFEIELHELKSRGVSNQQVISFERQFMSEVQEIFLPFQINQLQSWHIGTGLPKLLTETAYGDVVGLSETQKEKIRNKSQELADEIKEFIRTKRQEAAELVISELSMDQKSKVAEIFGGKRIDRDQMEMSLDSVWRKHSFESPDQPKAEPLRVWSLEDSRQ